MTLAPPTGVLDASTRETGVEGAFTTAPGPRRMPPTRADWMPRVHSLRRWKTHRRRLAPPTTREAKRGGPASPGAVAASIPLSGPRNRFWSCCQWPRSCSGGAGGLIPSCCPSENERRRLLRVNDNGARWRKEHREGASGMVEDPRRLRCPLAGGSHRGARKRHSRGCIQRRALEVGGIGGRHRDPHVDRRAHAMGGVLIDQNDVKLRLPAWAVVASMLPTPARDTRSMP